MWKKVCINREALAGTKKETKEKRAHQKLRDNCLQALHVSQLCVVDKFPSRGQPPTSVQGTLGSKMYLLSASAQDPVTGSLLLTDPSVPEQWLPQELKGSPDVEQQGC